MNSRNISIDILKIILAILVILLHCNFFYDYNEAISFLTVNGLSRVAVPTFFVINGYYFIYIKNIRKWVFRILILYTVWMLIYLPFWFELSTDSLVTILIGYNHLWYINALLISGIILYQIKGIGSRYLLRISLVLFISGSIILYFGNYNILSSYTLNNLANETYVHRNFLFLGLPFFIIGYLINLNEWDKKINKNIIIKLIFLGIILLLFESYANYILTKEGGDNLISLILICPMIFIYTLSAKFKYKIDSKYISVFSTAIYLIHPWVMMILYFIFKNDVPFITLLTIIVSMAASLLIIRINKVVKFLL